MTDSTILLESKRCDRTDDRLECPERAIEFEETEMHVGVIGSGVIGRTLAGRLALDGQDVTVGVRSPLAAPRNDIDPRVRIEGIAEAMAGADAVIVAIPGAQIPAFAREHAARLEGKIVIDATNDVGSGHAGTLNHLDAWDADAPRAIVTRAFCSVGWENFAEPDFGGTTATLFWCGRDGAAGETVEAIIRAVGLDPVRIGGLDAAATLDGVARLWFQLAFSQGMGRRLAFRLLRPER
jgi:predicted dinucleotide-binding enzyme